MACEYAVRRLAAPAGLLPVVTALGCLWSAAATDDAAFDVPEWLYPLNPTGSNVPGAPLSSSAELSVPDSDARYTPSQLKDFFAVPDWHPQDHPPMPVVVANGRKADLYACGYCDLPDGAGRPENATLAGLPAGYVVDQMAAFAGGARRSAWTGPTYLPAALMVTSAVLIARREIAEAVA